MGATQKRRESSFWLLASVIRLKWRRKQQRASPLRIKHETRIVVAVNAGTDAMIRMGIIGLGWWGKQIVTCLSDSRCFKVIAGCDIDLKMAAPFAATRNFDLTDDYKSLLKRSDIDAIAVVTPHLLHEEMAIAAFDAGKQVFCEKPLALTTASAERILAAYAKAGGVLGIGHERRYEPAMEEMRRLLETGTLGRVLHMDANISHNNFPRWTHGLELLIRLHNEQLTDGSCGICYFDIETT